MAGTLDGTEALGFCTKSSGKPLKSWKQVLDKVYVLKGCSGSVWRMGRGAGQCHKGKHGKPIPEAPAGE